MSQDLDQFLDSLTGSNGEVLNGEDEAFQQACPTLWRLFEETPDGPKGRSGFSMSLFRQDGHWRCCLSLRSRQKVLFLTLTSVQELFDTLEESITKTTVRWRDSSF